MQTAVKLKWQYLYSSYFCYEYMYAAIAKSIEQKILYFKLMQQKIYLSTIQSQSIINSSIYSSRKGPSKLISTILELEGQLYQAKIQNQELRGRQKELREEYQGKKGSVVQSKAK